MARYLINGETLTDIANAIRNKKGTSGAILTEDFASEIEGIIVSGEEYKKLLSDIISDSFRGDLVIPEGGIRIKPYIFRTSAFKSVTIPDSVKNIQYQAFRDCTSLESVTFGSGITTIADEAFWNNSNCLIYDFSRSNGVPSLGAANAFYSMSANAKILVPTSLYAQWTYATNWVSLISNIVSKETVRVHQYLNNEKIWVLGSGSWGRANNASSVNAYYTFNNGQKTALSYNSFGGLNFTFDYYDNGYDFIIYGDATFTEAGTYEIWVEDNNGKKLYRRILEVV